MKVLSSIINVYATSLKLIFRRRSTPRYYSCGNLALSSISCSRFEVTVSGDNGFLLNELGRMNFIFVEKMSLTLLTLIVCSPIVRQEKMLK